MYGREKEDKVWTYVGEYYGDKRIYTFDNFPEAVSRLALRVTPSKYQYDT